MQSAWQVTPTNGVLALVAAIGLGGGGGSILTKGQVEAAIEASERTIVGKLDRINDAVAMVAKDTARLSTELATEREKREALLERVHALEVKAASAGGGR